VRSQWAGLKMWNRFGEATALIDACAIKFKPTMTKAHQGEWRGVAEVGAIYPTQLFVNMLILKQIRN